MRGARDTGGGWGPVTVRVGVALCVLALSHPQRPAAASEPPETVEPGAACATAECHADVTRHEHLHYAELGSECRKCHAQEENLHEFSDAADVEVCWECHEDLQKKVEGAKVLHDPAEEDCLDCHEAHGSKGEGLLIAKDLLGLCFDCHEKDEVFGEEYEHGPVAEGSCTECHDPHASPRKKLLVASGSDLCLGCHDDTAEEFAQFEVIHDPAEDDCTDCHHPHSGPYPNMLPAEGRALCNECHDDIVEEAEAATVAHDPVLTRDECLTCHENHGGQHEPLLRQEPVALCLDCHDRPVESGDVQLADIRGWLDEHPVWHEPIEKDGCAECHEPHGGEHFRMLRKDYPETFYAGFSARTYALCFSCHERALVTVKSTRKETGFRDGDRNLHYVHVNKEEKGRTCRACHEVHASDDPLQVRESVPFGRWLLPINFEKSESGGRCAPGCHRTRSYDRNGR